MRMLNQPGLRNVNLQKVRMIERIAARNSSLANELRNMKLDWYTIRNAAGDDVEAESPAAEVFIYDEIGGSMGVNAMEFIDELNSITADSIVCRINSPGGLLIDGIAIGSALAQHPAHITTRVDGIAASAASIVALSGDVCEMMVGSQLMIHDVLCVCSGNAKEMRETAAWLEEQSQNVAQIYANKAGGETEEWRARMLAETWMFAEEAVELGLADSIYSRAKRSLPGQGMPDEEPDGDEPETPGEPEPDAEAADEDENEILENLMNRRHRLTNRGFKYSGRNKAPSPISNDAELDNFIAGMSRVLGRN